MCSKSTCSFSTLVILNNVMWPSSLPGRTAPTDSPQSNTLCISLIYLLIVLSPPLSSLRPGCFICFVHWCVPNVCHMVNAQWALVGWMNEAEGAKIVGGYQEGFLDESMSCGLSRRKSKYQNLEQLSVESQNSWVSFSRSFSFIMFMFGKWVCSFVTSWSRIHGDILQRVSCQF